MKALFPVLLAFLSISAGGQTIDEIFDRKARITWLGLDFTGTRFIGDRQRYGTVEDTKHLIRSLNDLMASERDKFDIGLAIDKLLVTEALDVTREHNASLDMSQIFSEEKKDFVRLRPAHIEAIISEYDFRGNRGLGIMLNIESFSKPEKLAAVWITFVNMDSRQVLFSERLTAEPGGGGLRNYWANAIHDMFTIMRKKEFEMWRKKYNRRY